MDCEAARERLPWLLNASLAGEESAALEAHLAGCAACREELGRAELAARLFATHPTSADLVAHAFGDLDAEHGRAVAEHVAGCQECRSELALVTAAAGTPLSTRAPT